MSQHDLNIANQGFPAFRADLNDALVALGSTNSGATAPATTFANQLWYDTANNILKIRNEDNDAWISIVTLDQSGDVVSAITAATVNATTVNTGALNATGVTTVQAGTAAAPAITTTGDTNTGIFFPAADTIAFAEGGVEAMRIDSSSRVGIGHTNPAFPLDIFAPTAVIRLNSTTGTNTAYLYTSNTGGDFYFAKDNSTGSSFGGSPYAAILYSSGAYPMQFYTNGSERLRIPADAAGIQFPAGQIASSNANTLDDYEEGTFTPTVSGATSYAFQVGHYTKIGNLVTYVISVNCARTASSTQFRISGLPFTSANIGNLYSVPAIFPILGFNKTGASFYAAQLPWSSTFFDIYGTQTASGNNFLSMSMNDTGPTIEVEITGHYYTS